MEDKTFIGELLDGAFDAKLEAIEAAIAERRRSLAAARAVEVGSVLEEGKRVRISPSARLSPKYLLGAVGRVTSVRRREGNAVLEFGEFELPPNSRFRRGGVVVPLEHLEAVEGGESL
jgi:hypothetical protein